MIPKHDSTLVWVTILKNQLGQDIGRERVELQEYLEASMPVGNLKNQSGRNIGRLRVLTSGPALDRNWRQLPVEHLENNDAVGQYLVPVVNNRNGTRVSIK